MFKVRLVTFESLELVEVVDLGGDFLRGVLFDVEGETGVMALSKGEVESGGVPFSVGAQIKIWKEKYLGVTNLTMNLATNVDQEERLD